MSTDKSWRNYADENLEVARLALDNHYYNACLQNAQQAIEKYLKATLITEGYAVKKTHNVEQLDRQLKGVGFETGLSEDECELLDAIYIPSKYPTGGVLPDFKPNKDISKRCIEIADKVRQNTER